MPHSHHSPPPPLLAITQALQQMPRMLGATLNTCAFNAHTLVTTPNSYYHETWHSGIHSILLAQRIHTLLCAQPKQLAMPPVSLLHSMCHTTPAQLPGDAHQANEAAPPCCCRHPKTSTHCSSKIALWGGKPPSEAACTPEAPPPQPVAILYSKITHCKIS